MKKLLSILCCFGFLLMAGMVYAQNEVPKTQGVERAKCNCTEMVQTEVVSAADIQGFTALFSKAELAAAQKYAIDIYKLRQASKEAVKKTNERFSDEALINRYSIVPECPVIYIGRQGKRYHNHYFYSPAKKYNQPPNYNI